MTTSGKSLIILLITTTLLVSCNKNDSPEDSKKLVPPALLVPILADLYLADGLLGFPPVRSDFSEKDSISTYIDILTRHGISKERMDNTMRYYFLKNPKKLEKIYDQVLARLSEMESELNAELPPVIPANANLWNLKDRFLVPEEGIQNTGMFNIEIRDTGMYEFIFTALIYEDDQGLNPRTTVYFWRPDSTEKGLSDYWDEMPLIKDGTRHNYTISKRLTDPSFTHIRGMLYNHDSQPARWEKHARFSDMIIRRGLIQ